MAEVLHDGTGDSQQDVALLYLERGGCMFDRDPSPVGQLAFYLATGQAEFLDWAKCANITVQLAMCSTACYELRSGSESGR